LAGCQDEAASQSPKQLRPIIASKHRFAPTTLEIVEATPNAELIDNAIIHLQFDTILIYRVAPGTRSFLQET